MAVGMMTIGGLVVIACLGESSIAWTPAPLFRSASSLLRSRAQSGGNALVTMCSQEPPKISTFTRRDAIIGSSTAALGCVGQPAVAMDKKKKPLPPVVATDKEMREFTEAKWLKKHRPGSRDLVVGLGGEPYFLLASKVNEGKIEPYALKAECTHLGCIAAWRQELGKHVCPCHGSEYAYNGAVLRGPAPRPLDLAKVEVLEDGKVQFSEWDAEDFRTIA